MLITSNLMMPTPFFPVHLLFMNLITDSLPAIAIGMEANSDNVLKEKPRKSGDSILNKLTLMQVGFEGFVIALSTMAIYMIGRQTSPAMASTLAFATICLARLLHGFNCRSNQPLHKIGFLSNKTSIIAFFVGFALLHIVLFVPALSGIFMVTAISAKQLLMIYGFALAPSIVVQIKKMISSK